MYAHKKTNFEKMKTDSYRPCTSTMTRWVALRNHRRTCRESHPNSKEKTGLTEMFKEQQNVVKTLWTEVFISPLGERKRKISCISAHKHRLHLSWGRIKKD